MITRRVLRRGIRGLIRLIRGGGFGGVGCVRGLYVGGGFWGEGEREVGDYEVGCFLA